MDSIVLSVVVSRETLAPRICHCRNYSQSDDFRNCNNSCICNVPHIIGYTTY